jgi:hypothetical protein
MKRTFLSITALALVTGLIAVTIIGCVKEPKPTETAVSGDTENHMTWFISEDHTTLDISGEGAMTSEACDTWFTYKQTIANIRIGEGITRIDNDVFEDCYNLTAIDVAPSNPNYCSVNGVLFDKNQSELIRCPQAKEGAYTVPGSVEKIRAHAFMNCYKLTKVTIGEHVSNGIFFPYCGRLKAILVAPENTYYSSEDGVLYNKDKTVLIQCPHDKKGAFTIPSSVKRIDTEAFYICSLTSITIGDHVEEIGDRAFMNSDLEMITLGKGIKQIGDEAFMNCVFTDETYIHAPTPPVVGQDAFYTTNNRMVICVPKSSLEAYQTAAYWKELKIRGIE